MDGKRKTEFLRELPFLEALPAAEVERLAEGARSRVYEPGQTIFLKGDETDEMMVVIAGAVSINSVSEEGKNLVLNTIRPGEIFGEIGVLDGGARTADGVATEATEILAIGRRSFLDLIRRNPGFALDLIRILCERVRRTSEQAEDLALLDLGRRLAKKLLSMAEEAAAGGGAVIRVTQTDLGAMMGTSRESINKQLRAWAGLGLIGLGRNEVEILDEAGLRERVERSD